jgi:hypothetical protein
MTRSRASAKGAGTSFETLMSGYLNFHVDDRIERRRLTGANDRGDIGGVRILGRGRMVLECKDTAGEYAGKLGTWVNEAETERNNDDAVACAVLAKRKGTRIPGQQLVIMTADDLVALLTGERPEPGWRLK